MPSTAVLDHLLAVPDETDAAQAAEAVDVLERFLRRHPTVNGASVSLTAANADDTLEIPGHALRALVDILAQIANGNAVTVDKRIDDAERRAVADELTAEAQRLGLDY